MASFIRTLVNYGRLVSGYLPIIIMELSREGYDDRRVALSLFRFFIDQNRVSH